MMRPVRLPRMAYFRSFLPRIRVPLLPVSTARPISSHSPTRLTLRRIDPIPPISRRFSSRSPSPISADGAPDAATASSLSGRLKLLIKSYGWYALGVYIAIGVVDFGVAFVGINFLGAEQVGKVTTYVKQMVKDVIHPSGTNPDAPGDAEVDLIKDQVAGGVGGQESLYAMLVLAYTVHKTLFLPVRVGLTAGFTPKLVKWLSARGWTGTSGAKRAATEVREKVRRRRDASPKP